MHASLTIEEYRALTSKPRAGRAAKGKPVSQEGNFAFQCKAQQLPEMIAQYRFPQSKHPNSKRRVWIADFAFLESKVMVEIDGGIWISGAHSHPLDVTRNMRKQNDAALLGFLTLRFTPKEVREGAAVAFTQRILERRQP